MYYAIGVSVPSLRRESNIIIHLYKYIIIICRKMGQELILQEHALQRVSWHMH